MLNAERHLPLTHKGPVSDHSAGSCSSEFEAGNDLLEKQCLYRATYFTESQF